MRRTLAGMAEITLRTDLAELATLAAFVEQFAGAAALPPSVAFQLNLVLDELVTNSIDYGHACEAGGSATIQLRLERVGEVIEIELVDQGLAFDPRTLPAPDLDARLETRRVGGLGIHLVRQYVDEFDYQRRDGRNHIRLRKRLTSPPGGGAAQ
jgi:anti-sigma regulatory factor (Ser/Thr protein kinase)